MEKIQKKLPELLLWFEENKRPLPWRDTRDPYKIWVSEIILQQTRVAQGLGYYERLIKKFPTIEAMATSSEQDILFVWQGLGYYSRAINMYQTSKIIVKNYQSKFPESFEELLQFKGIGRYTAAAIASNAFDVPVAALDGNVYRVLTRLLGIKKEITKKSTQDLLFHLANQWIPKKLPGKVNQTFIEFGALQCTPKPHCKTCLMQYICIALATQEQNQLPVKNKKLKIKKRYFNYFICNDKDKILIKNRVKNDIWKGLYDFILIETDDSYKREYVKNEFEKNITKVFSNFEPVFPIVEHKLTHQIINIQFFIINMPEEEMRNIQKTESIELVSLNQFMQKPKPIPIVNFLKKYTSLPQIKKEIIRS